MASTGQPGPGRWEPISRRRLFELGGATAALAALLAACGNDEAPPDAGRVGEAPLVTELPDKEVNDIVILRTLTSLSHSIIATYTSLSEMEGLGDGVKATLERFVAEHTAAASTLAELTTSASGTGTAYECPNTWIMDRVLQPAIDHIVGTSGDDAIVPTDDPTRDAIAMANALETMASASSQLLVTKLIDPALRPQVMLLGAQAGQRAAVAALTSNEPPAGFVNPLLHDPEAPVEADEAGFLAVYAIPARFGQLTPLEVQVGAADDEGTRYTVTLETPAQNAYVYESQSCSA